MYFQKSIPYSLSIEKLRQVNLQYEFDNKKLEKNFFKFKNELLNSKSLELVEDIEEYDPERYLRLHIRADQNNYFIDRNLYSQVLERCIELHIKNINVLDCRWYFLFGDYVEEDPIVKSKHFFITYNGKIVIDHVVINPDQEEKSLEELLIYESNYTWAKESEFESARVKIIHEKFYQTEFGQLYKIVFDQNEDNKIQLTFFRLLKSIRLLLILILMVLVIFVFIKT